MGVYVAAVERGKMVPRLTVQVEAESEEEAAALVREEYKGATCIDLYTEQLWWDKGNPPPEKVLVKARPLGPLLEPLLEERTGRAKALRQKQQKPPLYQGLLYYFPRALKAVAEVSAFGSKKHQFPLSDRGFLGPDYPIEGYADATVRHIADRAMEGEENEKDGGLYHLAQVAWNALAALEKVLIEEEEAEKQKGA